MRSKEIKVVGGLILDKNKSIISLTTSGKIRLVRQRLNLPKPERRK